MITVFFISLCFNMVSFRGKKKLGPRLQSVAKVLGHSPGEVGFLIPSLKNCPLPPRTMLPIVNIHILVYFNIDWGEGGSFILKFSMEF